jgi:hypothetical protein
MATPARRLKSYLALPATLFSSIPDPYIITVCVFNEVRTPSNYGHALVYLIICRLHRSLFFYVQGDRSHYSGDFDAAQPDKCKQFFMAHYGLVFIYVKAIKNFHPTK